MADKQRDVSRLAPAIARSAFVLCVLTDERRMTSEISWHSARHAHAFSQYSSMSRNRDGRKFCASIDTVMFTANPDQFSCDVTDLSADHKDNQSAPTTAVLKLAYDGTHFRGWTGGRRSPCIPLDNSTTGDTKFMNTTNAPERSQPKRSRRLKRKGSAHLKNSNTVRTVDQTLRASLAKIYGNVSPNDIVIDSCSRTDAGVHAISIIAQFYCFPPQKYGDNRVLASKDTWAQLRPTSPTDPKFLPLPFNADLCKLVFVLNRMLPPDVRVIASSPVPDLTPIRDYTFDIRRSMRFNAIESKYAFHPALHVAHKTYTYQFAVGPLQDPIRSQYIWHLDGSSGRAVGINGERFSLKRATEAANIFTETIRPRDYSSFRSVFRGNERGRIQSTLCTLLRCEIVRESTESLPSWEHKFDDGKNEGRLCTGRSFEATEEQRSGSEYNTANEGTYIVVITGDRFLYKMVRNIVGSIIAVACGALELSDLHRALEGDGWDSRSEICELGIMRNSSDMRRICAPARGLTMSSIEYSKEISFVWLAG